MDGVSSSGCGVGVAVEWPGSGDRAPPLEAACPVPLHYDSRCACFVSSACATHGLAAAWCAAKASGLPPSPEPAKEPELPKGAEPETAIHQNPGVDATAIAAAALVCCAVSVTLAARGNRPLQHDALPTVLPLLCLLATWCFGWMRDGYLVYATASHVVFGSDRGLERRGHAIALMRAPVAQPVACAEAIGEGDGAFVLATNWLKGRALPFLRRAGAPQEEAPPIAVSVLQVLPGPWLRLLLAAPGHLLTACAVAIYWSNEASWSAWAATAPNPSSGRPAWHLATVLAMWALALAGVVSATVAVRARAAVRLEARRGSGAQGAEGTSRAAEVAP